MRIFLTLALLLDLTILIAQPYSNSGGLKIYNADELLNEAKLNGLENLPVDPIDLIRVDSSYIKPIVDLVFENIYSISSSTSDALICRHPEITLNIISETRSKYAIDKLFEFYCSLPKVIKSDTIYLPYRQLDQIIQWFTHSSNKHFQERLIKDFHEWTKIAQVAPQKQYLCRENHWDLNLVEKVEYQENYKIVDCDKILLHIASALKTANIGKVTFAEIEKLKNSQTWPFANNYKFPVTFQSKMLMPRTKVLNNSNIQSFKNNSSEIEALILKSFEACCDAKLTEIIEKDNIGYCTISRSNGYDFYRVQINDQAIKIEVLGQIMEFD